MSHPSWITDALICATTWMYTASDQALTVELTPDRITFNRADGETYSTTLAELLDHNQPVVDFNDLAASTSPPPTDLLTPPPLPLAAPSPAPQFPPAASSLSEELLDLKLDIELALPVIVPDLGLLCSNPEDQLTYLFREFKLSPQRSRQNRCRKLHLAYELGLLKQQYPDPFKVHLESTYTDARTARRYQAAMEKAYLLGSRIGLDRLYGTSRLTYADLHTMSKPAFKALLS